MTLGLTAYNYIFLELSDAYIDLLDLDALLPASLARMLSY